MQVAVKTFASSAIAGYPQAGLTHLLRLQRAFGHVSAGAVDQLFGVSKIAGILGTDALHIDPDLGRVPDRVTHHGALLFR
jgi:hypothetical protein